LTRHGWNLFCFPKTPYPYPSTSLPHLPKPTLETLSLCRAENGREDARQQDGEKRNAIFLILS
jgi:hypothetical protein